MVAGNEEDKTLRTMMKQRCSKCDSNLFLSDDPMDGPGTLYCLAGHTFYAKVSPQAREAARSKQTATAA